MINFLDLKKDNVVEIQIPDKTGNLIHTYQVPDDGYLYLLCNINWRISGDGSGAQRHGRYYINRPGSNILWQWLDELGFGISSTINHCGSILFMHSYENGGISATGSVRNFGLPFMPLYHPFQFNFGQNSAGTVTDTFTHLWLQFVRTKMKDSQTRNR